MRPRVAAGAAFVSIHCIRAIRSNFDRVRRARDPLPAANRLHRLSHTSMASHRARLQLAPTRLCRTPSIMMRPALGRESPSSGGSTGSTTDGCHQGQASTGDGAHTHVQIWMKSSGSEVDVFRLATRPIAAQTTSWHVQYIPCHQQRQGDMSRSERTGANAAGRSASSLARPPPHPPAPQGPSRR
eukprot:scaffold1465_cov383-Prasinococcus_capsulatus_cf.AAC.18